MQFILLPAEFFVFEYLYKNHTRHYHEEPGVKGALSVLRIIDYTHMYKNKYAAFYEEPGVNGALSVLRSIDYTHM